VPRRLGGRNVANVRGTVRATSELRIARDESGAVLIFQSRCAMTRWSAIACQPRIKIPT